MRLLNVSQAKTELYGLLRQEKPAEGEPFPPGWVHHYREEDEFYRQITAEAFVTRIVKGFQRGEWIKLRPRNEALDCANLARGAHEQYTAGFRESHWRALEAHLTVEKPAAAERSVAESPAAPLAKKKARRSWKLSI